MSTGGGLGAVGAAPLSAHSTGGAARGGLSQTQSVVSYGLWSVVRAWAWAWAWVLGGVYMWCMYHMLPIYRLVPGLDAAHHLALSFGIYRLLRPRLGFRPRPRLPCLQLPCTTYHLQPRR
jgi:hypothetical protein